MCVMRKMRDLLVHVEPSILKHNFTPYSNSLPTSVLSDLVVAAQATRNLSALLDVATRCAEHYVRPAFWAVGMISQSPKEVVSLAEIVSHVAVKSPLVCEIGFNAGHSALLWLRQRASARLVVFDLFGLPHSLASLAFVRGVYPGRVTAIPGNSRVTVTAFADQVANGTQAPCDIWFVDGDHTGETPRVDLWNAVRASRAGAVVIADDVTTGWFAVKRTWDRLVSAGHLRHERCQEEVLCAKGVRAPSRRGGKGKWLGDSSPLSSCEAPRCVPRNDATTRCFKKRWCWAKAGQQITSDLRAKRRPY